MLGEFFSQHANDARNLVFQSRHPVDCRQGEMKPVKFIQNGHIERRCRRALLNEAAHVNIAMIGAFTGQTMTSGPL